ncbi:MAG: asparaginase [Actinomycetota bacterium]|nr:asparaginase [Actinomycetota bacterium]
MPLPKVSVLSLGGTISSVKTGGPGVSPSLTGEDLVASVPQLSEVAEVSAASVRQVPGWALTLDDLVEVAAEAGRRLDGGASGVVVTQGTDSIEETAFALDLLVGGEGPVVVTGAMRNPTLPGADGPANLLAAVTVAASGAARGLEVLVVMNDEIHAARYVRKTHTQSPAAFRSPTVGPIGWVSEGAVRIPLRPKDRRHIRLPEEIGGHDVALIKVWPGDDGRLIRAAGDLGYDGLVVEGFGGGHVPPATVEPLERLAARMPVVVASRTGGGETLARTYDAPGSEMDLQGRGLVPAGALDGPKARLLLALLLRSGASREEIHAAFDA